MNPSSYVYLSMALAVPALTHAAAPEEYAVTDITNWSAAQLGGLPHFRRFVPVAPAGAGADFTAVAQSGFGVAAGNRNFAIGGWVQGSGAFVKAGQMESISAWLRGGSSWSYSWARTWWDGDDIHFANGFVTHSPARDVNALGQVIGYATIPGSGESSGGYSDHAYLRDAGTGAHHDITPEATRADPRAINDLGEIVGTWSNADGSHPFRRAAGGAFADFTLDAPTSYGLTPVALNNRGQAAGNAIVYTVPIRDQRPFFCAAGTASTQLPLPDQNSPDAGTVADMNEHAVIVGEAHKADAFTETSGVRWVMTGNSWQADDLNELLADHEPQMIIDRAVAINDAGFIIATGHPDGTDALNTRRILLTPEFFARPAVSTLRPASVGATGAVLRAKINPANSAATYRIEFGADAGYGSAGGEGEAGGTAPVMAELALAGLQPHTTYHYRAVAANGEGQTEGIDQTFTTQWDWPTWAAQAGLGEPNEDGNGNGCPDLIDYATGSDAPRTPRGRVAMLTFTYRRDLSAGGVDLAAQVSADLDRWREADASEITVTPDGTGGEVVTIARSHAGADRFICLTAALR
ncbi:MAG: hypothetical protein R3F11_09540 [Verrucomicrobiales bacterium]